MGAETIIVLAVAILAVFGMYKYMDQRSGEDAQAELAQQQEIDEIEASYAQVVALVKGVDDRFENIQTALEKLDYKIEANKKEIGNLKQADMTTLAAQDRLKNEIRADVEASLRHLPSTLQIALKSLGKEIPIRIMHQSEPKSISEITQVKKTKTGYVKKTRRRTRPTTQPKRKRKKKIRTAENPQYVQSSSVPASRRELVNQTKEQMRQF